MDHTQAPVLDALAAFRAGGYVPFTPPGHKQGRGTDPDTARVLGADVFGSDVLAISGLDDRRSTHRVLDRAQELMADAVGAARTFFTTCGSSLSVKSAMLSVAGPHEKLVVGRDAHKSVVSGLILSGIRPVWVSPQWDAERNLAHPPSVDGVAAALADHPDARGVLVTSPTPYGTCADLAGITDVCHRHGVPLIVDEAWGAHLPFLDDLPSWAMDCGADVCVTSVHKMGGALEQSSVFHLQGDLVDPDVLAARADLLGTTSPSVLVYAALDGWRRHMVLHGKDLLRGALDLAERTRERLGAIDGIHVDGAEFVGPGLAYERDPLQVVLDLSELGVSGYRAADWLYDEHRVSMHLADHRRISAQLTYADDTETADRLVSVVRDLAEHAGDLRGAPTVAVADPAELDQELVCLPRDAFFGRTEQVPADEAVGRVAAEMLTPYPPGIPVVVPGERVTAPVWRYLRSGVAAGMVVPDAADAALGSLRALRE